METLKERRERKGRSRETGEEESALAKGKEEGRKRHGNRDKLSCRGFLGRGKKPLVPQSAQFSLRKKGPPRDWPRERERRRSSHKKGLIPAAEF